VCGVTEDVCSRRALLRGLAAIGVTTIGAGVLTACSSDDASGGAASPGDVGDGSVGASPDDAGSDGDGGSGGAGSAAAGVPASEVPVGEARVVDLAGQRLVVAQPKAGEFVAFSARCTHQGVEVEPAGGLKLRCPGHGSRFDAATGKVLNGPAANPLADVKVALRGTTIVPA